MTASLRKTIRLLASLKIAIPLLVVLTVVTVIGSLFPTPELFRTKWYLGLLGVLGLSLLLITIQHAPLILKRKGRNAMIGVIATHVGILVIIVGMIYGGFSGFRHEVRLIEGQVTVVPGLPFTIQLDELRIEEYRQEDFPRMNLAVLPKKQQDSHLTLWRGGKVWRTLIVAPGNPARVDGISLVPSIGDVGFTFELIIEDPLGREKTMPVHPWAPPLITLGNTQVMAHGTDELQEVRILGREGDKPVLLGAVRNDESLDIEGHTVRLGRVRHYSSFKVYNRPQEPILVWGSVLMFLGLVWHFYFRHRDRRREGQADA